MAAESINSGAELREAARAFVERMEWSQAEAVYMQALRDLVTSASSSDAGIAERVALHSNLALTQLRQRSADRALASSEEALKLDPTHVKSIYRRAQALSMRGGPGDSAAAIAALERLAEAHPNNAEAAALLQNLRAGVAAHAPHSTNRLEKHGGIKSALAKAFSSGKLYEDRPSVAPAPASAIGGGGAEWLPECLRRCCCRRKKMA